MANAEWLKTEIETYEREKARLVAESEGKYALVHGDSVAGIWDTYTDALKAGYGQFGLKPFLVKQIRSIEPVYVLNRNVVGCQS